jgi:hypothetical protein
LEPAVPNSILSLESKSVSVTENGRGVRKTQQQTLNPSSAMGKKGGKKKGKKETEPTEPPHDPGWERVRFILLHLGWWLSPTNGRSRRGGYCYTFI